MAKQRKTRQMKKASDSRTQKKLVLTQNSTLETISATPHTYSLNPQLIHQNDTAKHNIKSSPALAYTFVAKDLLKTGIVTGIIVTLEVLLAIIK